MKQPLQRLNVSPQHHTVRPPMLVVIGSITHFPVLSRPATEWPGNFFSAHMERRTVNRKLTTQSSTPA
jgi:hypothetical protein